MLPRHHLRPAQPLLSFPPEPPRLSLPRREEERPRSTLFKVVAFLPLVFIFALLAFAAYALLWSLCGYLLRRGHYLKSVAYAVPGAWLLFGCGGNLWMAYWRGGGVVPGAGQWKRRDEEEQLEREGVKDEVERFVLGEEDDREEEQLGRGEAEEAREEQALLDGQEETGALGDTGHGSKHRAIQVKSDGKARFCRKCCVFKPDRSHHCSTCRRCVLKLDHHCPWLGGGCVGWANYKFFLLFLLYTGALGIFVGAVLFHELANYVDDVEQGFELAPISWALAALLGCIFGIAVGLFGLYHLYLACNNRSTIEAMEHPTSVLPGAQPPRRQELDYKQRRRLASAARQFNIYDLGVKENLRQVFGGKERAWEWVMPWGWPPGDGQTFPIDEEKLHKLRRATEQVYAEAAGRALTSSGRRSGDYSDMEPSDEDGPIRRA
ncbi:hypothetical protein JCM11641_002307 [Rhodosporidiobolus odoratus]